MSLLLKGVTKLSELTIDADKDWAIKGIDSLGYVIIEDGAGHYLRLPSLTTAQRDDLTPAAGMTIWNSTTTQVERYNGSDWGAMGIAGVTVRKNTMMPVIGNRPQLNLIEGASVDINIADNPPDDEIDITISAKYPTRFKLLIPDNAAEAVPGGETKAALANVAGTNFGYETLDFDHTAEEVAYWEAYLTPDYLSENIVVDIFWESAGAGDAKFGFSVLGREKGEDWDVALGVEQTVVTTNLGAGKLNKSRISTFAPGWSAGDVILFKLARKAGDVADTIDGDDVRVLKVVVSYTGQFAQAFYPIPEPVDLGIAASDAWTEVDAGVFGVPTGATGVILHSMGNPVTQEIGLRKKGSSDNRIEDANPGHFWAMCGIDENRKFEVYLGNHGIQKVYIVGYTATGVVFLDNGIEKIPAGYGAWQDIDCSAECPGALAIIFELRNDISGDKYYKIRKNGSADSRLGTLHDHNWYMMGCDAGQIVNVNLSAANVHLYIIGYVTQGAVFKTNGVRKMVANVDVWDDIDCSGDAPSAVMIFFEVYTTRTVGIRKNGSTEEIYDAVKSMCGSFVACDSGQKIEVKTTHIEAAPIGYFIFGYATWAGA